MKRVLSLFSFLLLFACVYAGDAKAKYVFYFIADGIGMNHISLTEMYLAQKDGKIGAEKLYFTDFPYSAFSRTFSSEHSITDSSAAGSALSTGSKTKNKAVAMDPELKKPVESIASKAKKKGNSVGILTSVPINHATPASFYAHAPSRAMHYDIAKYMLDSNYDFFGGSGIMDSEFPEDDKKDIYALLKKKKYNVARGMDEYDRVKNKSKKIVLVQEKGKNVDAIPFAIDRKPGDMTLPQITESAIEFLSKKNKGFFMMIEGGKIDWAAHSNDAGAVINEIIDMDEAVKHALDFYKQCPDSTLIVVTSDHETGGLGLGISGYTLALDNLQYQKLSQSGLSEDINNLFKSNPNINWDQFKEYVSDKTGFWTKYNPSEKQTEEIKGYFLKAIEKREVEKTKTEYSEDSAIASLIIRIINKNAKIGWTSNTHTAAYVPVFAIGAGAENFRGVIDNTDIPKIISEIAGY